MPDQLPGTPWVIRHIGLQQPEKRSIKPDEEKRAIIFPAKIFPAKIFPAKIFPVIIQNSSSNYVENYHNLSVCISVYAFQSDCVFLTVCLGDYLLTVCLSVCPGNSY